MQAVNAASRTSVIPASNRVGARRVMREPEYTNMARKSSAAVLQQIATSGRRSADYYPLNWTQDD